MDALICDFDGVIVDSEPVHFKCYQQVLAEDGISLSRDEYYGKYLGFDDFDCFELILTAVGRSPDDDTIRKLVARKTAYVQAEFTRSIQAMPGAIELLRQAEMATIPIAVCSGALRQEIELASTTVGARGYFMAIVGADDVTVGKPHPEGYKLALSSLCRLTGRVLQASRTLVVEDSPAGIDAAKRAGMKVLAVTTSYGLSHLTQADCIVANLTDVTVADIEKITAD